LKKEAKTFATGATPMWRQQRDEVPAGAKVFWFFFSKKNSVLPLRCFLFVHPLRESRTNSKRFVNTTPTTAMKRVPPLQYTYKL
jgi:hypothetical protein